MYKLVFVVVDQVRKKLMKLLRKLSNTNIRIAIILPMKLDIHYQILLNHLKKAPIKNRFDILGATRKDAQEFSLSCFRLRNFT